MSDISDDAGQPGLPAPPARIERIVYFGTPEAAVAPLRALVEAGFDVALVVTRDDKRRGRREAATATPVKLEAMRLGIPVSEDPGDAIAVEADLGVVVAYGRLLRRPLLDRLPMVNLHFSLLPRWRGAAPVERAILAGDDVTGVCVMAVDDGLDTGAVYARKQVTIRRSSTAAQLETQLTEVGSKLLVRTLRTGLGEPEPQVGEPVYAAKIGSPELHLDWTRPATELERIVRVGGAWSTFRGRRMKVVAAEVVAGEAGAEPGSLVGDVVACADGGLRLVTVQPEGKTELAFSAWANGARPDLGERFDGEER